MNSSHRNGEPDRSGPAIVILAAGLGSRFGGGKLDAQLHGKPVGLWAIQTAQQAGFARQIIVVGPTAPRFVSNLVGWEIFTNELAAGGMGTSIATAARAAAGSTNMVVALADMPLVSARHLRELRDMDAIAYTSYPGGRSGVPAAFPARCLSRLATLKGDEGAASIEWGETVERMTPPADSELDDVDTVACLERLRATARPQ